MAIAVNYAIQASVIRTLSGAYVSSADAGYTVNGLNQSGSLSASTTPPVTKSSTFDKALVAGAATIDLTSLPDDDGNVGAVDFTGLKPQVVILTNKSTNANAITIAKGASNGYTGFGAAFSITLQPGDTVAFKGNDNAGVTDVASGARTLDLSGTGTQVLQVQLIAG
jgi:hypothetical protein